MEKRRAPLQPGAHLFARQMGDHAGARIRRRQHAGKEGGLFLQHLIARGVGAQHAALRGHEAPRGMASRGNRNGIVPLSAMRNDQVRAGLAQRQQRCCARLRIRIGNPRHRHVVAGIACAHGAGMPGFIEAAASFGPEQHYLDARAHDSVAPVATTTGPQACACWRT
ncbi:hypothetical protein D3C72_1752040 [compost metagenome]